MADSFEERCSEEVADERGYAEPCGQPATGYAIHEGYAVYPACERHRWVPLHGEEVVPREEVRELCELILERGPLAFRWPSIMKLARALYQPPAPDEQKGGAG